MKYIRTKKGVWEYDKLTKQANKPNTLMKCHTIWLNVKETDILEQSDTIEELCDEFIVVSDNCERPIISALPFNELQLYAKGRTKYAVCYGAIWTDKGLIYVAKMNDKGELELL